MAGLASKLGSLLPGSKPTNLLAVAVNHSKVGINRHRDILQGKVSQGKFSNFFVVAGGWFLFLLEPSTN